MTKPSNGVALNPRSILKGPKPNGQGLFKRKKLFFPKKSNPIWLRLRIPIKSAIKPALTVKDDKIFPSS
jgi:hypothetical protein